MTGTIVNSLAIVIGCLLGIVIKDRLTDKISNTIMQGLALCILYIGISGTLKSKDSMIPMIMIGSMVVGAIIGEIIDIDKWLNKLGDVLEKKFKKEGNKISISEGFVSSSLLFCVGAMAILGALNSGLKGDNSTLYVKSILDGVTSIILASSLGIGVIFSSVTVLIYQGAIALSSSLLVGVLNTQVIDNMTAVGSLLIVALGLNMLKVTKIKVANLLPAVVIPIIIGLFM